ncbi:MAG TPA: ABC transporter substrate-binding protein [Burkholderiales bacterium]|nr:ABC transporter substrate-binding protein [Burkholderiales bacterium]
MRIVRSLIVALCMAGVAVPVAALAQNAIVIGQSTPLTGSNKELGTDIRQGALAYFKKVNDAGGINGRKIELVTLDDANDTKRAEANTRQLLEQNNPIALFGYASATLSRPALPHVEAAKITFFAPFTGADPMRKFNRYVYNHRASYADELEKIVEHYTTFGIKKFAVLHYDDVIGNENFNAVDRALKSRNLSPVAVAKVTRKQTDFAKEVAAVAKAGPDVVILTTLYKTSADFIKLMKKHGVGAQFVSTSFAGSTALANSLGGDGLGVAMSQVTPSYLRRAVPVVREYQAAMEAAFGKKEFSYSSLESYIAAKVLVDGLRRAGPQPTREGLLRALDGVNVDVGGYIVAFSPTNHNGSSFVSLSILGRDLAFRE